MPEIPGPGCTFNADSTIGYNPGRQFTVTLITGLGINCLPGSVSDELPQGVQIVKSADGKNLFITGKIPVDLTMLRFVRKPAGAMPGKVIYTDYKTLTAQADEALAVRLAQKK